MEDFTISFQMKIDTAAYAKRFGVSLPDDSMDVTLTDETQETIAGEEASDAEGSPAVAEDAAISYRKAAAAYDPQNTQCKATFAQCKAKNPMTCRYHGAKIIAQDIENDLVAAGIQSSNIDVQIAQVDTKNGRQILTLNVVVKGKAKDKQAVKTAMRNFFALPGVDGDPNDVDYASGEISSLFDIDMLDPNAQAKWGAGQQPPQQQQPAQQPKAAPTPAPAPAPAPKPATPQPTPQPKPAPAPAPQPTGPRKHPIAPPDQTPPPPPPFTQQDIDDLKAARDKLEASARCLNGRLGDLPRLQASSRWPTLSSIPGDKDLHDKLDALSKNSDAAIAQAAKDLKAIVDAIDASSKNGWTTGAGMVDDATTFASKLPKPAPVPVIPQTEEQKRNATIDVARKEMRGATGKAKTDLDEALSMMEEASATMTDMENNIAAIDDAIASETDPDAQAALEGLLADVEVAYAKAEKEFKDATQKIKDWASKQRWMAPGMTIQDVMDGYKARGLPPPKALVKYQGIIDAHKDAAWALLKQEYGFTDAERKHVEETWKKNVAALLDKAVFLHITRDLSWLFNKGALVQNGCYDEVTQVNNGYTPKRDAQGWDGEASVFCRAVAEDDPAQVQDWWGGKWGVVLNPKKMVASYVPTLLNGVSEWGKQSNKARTSLMSDSSITTACDNTKGMGHHGYVSKDALTKDLTGLPTKDLLRKLAPKNHPFYQGYDGCNEVYVHQGIRPESITILKWFGSGPVPAFSAQEKKIIQANNIKIVDGKGKEVKI